MNFLKNLFNKPESPINSKSDFWNWFKTEEKQFFKAIKNQDNVPEKFFNKLAPKLNQLHDGIFFLAGMYEENTAELVLTADGNIKNMYLIEQLVNAAPKIDNWKITAHKPEMKNGLGIDMHDLKFDEESLFFFVNENDNYPDEIELTFIHKDYSEARKDDITQGTFIFLDNYLGELKFTESIDYVNIGNNNTEKELISITKLKDYLNWREKEFIEKYDGVFYNSEDDEFGVYNAELENGEGIIAIMNKTLLTWDRMVSHPWMAFFTIKFEGKNQNGMPNDSQMASLNIIEEEMLTHLHDKDGNLNIGRETRNNTRTIFFVCKDFRKVSEIFHNTEKKFAHQHKFETDIFKDKYWRSLSRFLN